MSKDETVERIAKLIYDADALRPRLTWERLTPLTQGEYRKEARAALSAMPGRFYWLIERSAPREFFGFAEGAPIYVCLIYGKPWTDKADEALRFSRREDATQYWHRYEARDPALRIVEHGDIPALPPRELLREALSALDRIVDFHIGDCPMTMEEIDFAKNINWQIRKTARAAADKIRASLTQEPQP